MPSVTHHTLLPIILFGESAMLALLSFMQQGATNYTIDITRNSDHYSCPRFHKLFMVMGCVCDINTVHKTVEKLTFQAFY